MTLSLGFSPCPNDCFMFDAIVHRRIDLEDLDFSVAMDDVEALNRAAWEIGPAVRALNATVVAVLESA
jgi:1,4-dihydroxy-6-naphthoate synthase